MCTATRTILKLAGGAAAACLYLYGPTTASALTINRMTASTAAATIGQTYDTHVALGPGLDFGRHVSFNVLDPSDLGGRTSAISYLAHQLDANRHAVLIVGKSNGNAWRAPLALDTAINVSFGARTLPAKEVLERIAYVDNARIELNTPITGDVTLPSTTVPATQAAYEVAMQTHTTLNVYYRLTARNPILATASLPVEATPVRVHRTERYAHRRTRGSISITSAAPAATAPTGPVPVYGNPPATETGPAPAEPSFNNPFTRELNSGPVWNYGYGYGYWNSPPPYTFGNGSVTILPSYPASGPTLLFP
jgi:hypothetical protein